MALPFALPPLPTFLQPLALIPHFQTRLAESLNGWIRGDSDRIFGPLEQAVTAVVVIGLAMQAPPNLWSEAPVDPSRSTPSSNETSTTSTSVDIPAVVKDVSSLAQATDPVTLMTTIQPLLKRLTPDPLTLVTIALVINVVVMLIPRSLKNRLKTSWNLFWPPWQDRTPNTERPAPDADRPSARARDPEVKSDAEAIRAAAKASSGEMTAEEKERLKRRQKEKLKEAELAKAKEKEREKMQEAKSTSGEATKTKSTEGVKASNVSKDGSMPTATVSGTRDPGPSSPKGKERMEGERPRSRTVTPAVATSDSKTSGDKTAHSETSGSKPSPSSPDASDGSATDPDTDTDPLMAGDYRPLKSALKKSKKKPRQHKNIHHNNFLTMRGHKPSLIPFPHGLHPKPHHPRHNLWFDNVPKNVDHMMAPPPVPKAPEGDDPDEKEVTTTVTKEKTSSEADPEGGTKSSAETTTTTTKEKVPMTKEDTAKRAGRSDGSGSSTASDKAKVDLKSKDGDADKEKDRDKEKERAKLKAKAEAEAKEKEKEKAKAKAAAEAKAKGASSSKPPPAVTIDPKLQKATFVSQGLLCCLLYMVHEQLAFLLMAFFVYQYIQKHDSGKGQRSSTSDSSSSTTGSAARSSRPPPDPTPDKSRKKSQPSTDEMREARKARSNDAVVREYPPKTSSTSEILTRVAEAERVAKEETRKTTGKKDKVSSDTLTGVKGPLTMNDLTAEQKERYLRVKARKEAKSEANAKAKDKIPNRKTQEHEATVKAAPETTKKYSSRPARTLADLSESEREKYLEARRARKDAEIRARRVGQASGLSAEEKEGLVSPTS